SAHDGIDYRPVHSPWLQTLEPACCIVRGSSSRTMGSDPSVPEYRGGSPERRQKKRLAGPIPSRDFLLCSAANLAATAGAASNEVVNRQDNDRPDYRGDKTGRLPWLVPTHCAPDPACEK